MPKISALRPQDVPGHKEASMPDAVIEAWNELILEKFANGEALIDQEDVVELMVAKGLARSEIFSKGWLNVEGIFQAAGWKVKYDSPAYDESYKAYFVFKVK